MKPESLCVHLTFPIDCLYRASFPMVPRKSENVNLEQSKVCDIITAISVREPPSEKVLDERSKRTAKSAAFSSSALERGATVGNSECFDGEREH